MTTIEFAQKITDIIDARPRRMDLDALLYEINIRTKGAPTKHVSKGGWGTYGDVMATLLNTKTHHSNGRKKNSKQALAISAYAQKIVPLINARPRYIRLDRLLYTIYVQAGIAESRREQQEGRWVSHEQVMKNMWKLIYSNLKKQNHLKIIKASL
jgi:hypothetical protein